MPLAQRIESLRYISRESIPSAALLSIHPATLGNGADIMIMATETQALMDVRKPAPGSCGCDSASRGHTPVYPQGEHHPRRTTDEEIASFTEYWFPFGRTVPYCNLGYGIIKRITEEVCCMFQCIRPGAIRNVSSRPCRAARSANPSRSLARRAAGSVLLHTDQDPR